LDEEEQQVIKIPGSGYKANRLRGVVNPLRGAGREKEGKRGVPVEGNRRKFDVRGISARRHPRVF